MEPGIPLYAVALCPCRERLHQIRDRRDSAGRSHAVVEAVAETPAPEAVVEETAAPEPVAEVFHSQNLILYSDRLLPPSDHLFLSSVLVPFALIHDLLYLLIFFTIDYLFLNFSYLFYFLLSCQEY